MHPTVPRGSFGHYGFTGPFFLGPIGTPPGLLGATATGPAGGTALAAQIRFGDHVYTREPAHVDYGTAYKIVSVKPPPHLEGAPVQLVSLDSVTGAVLVGAVVGVAGVSTVRTVARHFRF